MFKGMREELQAVVEELKAMRASGVSHVYLQDATLAELRAAFVRSEAGGTAAAPRPRQTEAGAGTRRAAKSEAADRRTDDRGEMVLPLGEGPARPPRGGTAAESASAAARPAPIPEPPAVDLPRGEAVERMAWLRQRVLGCPVCKAHVKPGKAIVFGVGSVEADIFFCGEAPGAEEEARGEPFVGPAGQLLTKIIAAMGLSRDAVYIGNIMNWRPEMPTSVGNRPPTTEEMAFCLPYLRAQVEIVSPKVIVALGKTAVDGLLGPDPKRKMGRVRGKWAEFQGIPLLPTFHPSYLLRNGTLRAKRMVWEDMMLVMERVGLPLSERQRRYFLGA